MDGPGCVIMEEALPIEGPDMPSPRRSKRGRWLTWLTILTGLGVTVLFVIEERLTVLELWTLSDLDTLELEVKKTRIGDLSRFGSDRSARKFIDHQVDRLDRMLGHGASVAGIGPPGEDAAVDRRVQGLDAAVHDLRKPGVFADLDHGDAGLA